MQPLSADAGVCNIFALPRHLSMTHARGVWLGAMMLVPLASSGQQATVFDHVVAERWVNGRQRPAFTPMQRHGYRMILTRVADTLGQGRIVELTFTQHMGQPGTARLVTDSRGRVLAVEAQFHELRTGPGPAIVGPDEQLRWLVFDDVEEGEMALPETRVWDLIPVVRGGPLRKGARWVDTLNLSATLKGSRQTLRGIRTSTVVGDTVIAGAPLWVVRDSATVSYAERFVSGESTIDTQVVIERSATGPMVGRYLYDPAQRLFRWRADTAHLSGHARLEYADGRTFTTPTTFDQLSRIEMVDSAARAAIQHRQDSIAAGFSILMRPEGNAQQLANDARDPAIATRARAAMLSAGDTTTVLHALTEQWQNGPTDTNDLAIELPVMADPGVAFAFGINRDWLYDNASRSLLRVPPAITPDSTRWVCTPAACRMLAAQWTMPVDQRLRDVALIARMTMEPAVWSDTVLSRWKAGDHFLDDAAMLVRGVATTWAAGSKDSIPGSDADWHAWSSWMDGHASGFSRLRQQLVRFEESHRTTIRFAQARTGRNFAGEWRRKMREALDDTTRVVFAEMLCGLGEMADDTAGILANLRSASPLRHQLGADEVIAAFSKPSSLASPALATELQDSVLAVAIDSAPPWPALDSSARFLKAAQPRMVVHNVDRAYGSPYPAPGPLILIGDSLTPAVRDRWSKRGIRIADATVRVPSNESAVELTVGAVHVASAFARIMVVQTHLTARINGRGESWAAGSTLYLLHTTAGWVVVSASSWIT
jgi:hypothetical protein